MEGDYDPYSARTGHAMTNKLETFIHLVKSSLGTGILAMPKAFSYVGLAEGGVLVFAMGAFCVYGLHLLINNLYLVCKAQRVPVLGYGDGFQGAVAMGPRWLQPLKPSSVYVVEFFLLTYQLGICCVYIVFSAKSFSMVAEALGGPHVPDVAYMTAVAAAMLLLVQIRNLKVLAPVSLVANVAMIVGQIIIWCYVLRDLPPTAEGRPLSGPPSGLPHFMGIVLFAMESLGVIISLENNMAEPAAFPGRFGVLNAGMAVVIAMYAFLGFFGFYRYGPEVADVLIFNLPADWPGQTVRVVYALAVALSYPLQLWPVVETVWGKYVARQGPLEDPEDADGGCGQLWGWETPFRAALVLLTFLIAICLPNLDFIISLLGVFCLSMLGVTFPAVMEMCTRYERGYGPMKWILIKDGLIAGIGVLVLVVGLCTCILDLVADS